MIARLRELAQQNIVNKSFIGTGYHDTYTPPVIQRNVLENPGWYTAYTPYQPEISQGRLEALLTYQQMILDLTGMDLANASMLDEGTAAAEAMTLLHRVNKKNRSNTFLVADDCHPQTIAVVKTRAEALDIEVIVGKPEDLVASTEAFGLLLQYPGTYGHLDDISPLIEKAHAAKTLVAVAADIMALLLVKSPGALGADVVVGNSQRFRRPHGLWRPARGVLSPHATPTSVPPPAALSAYPSTGAATRRCAWPCKPANSTSAGKRPPVTSVPRRPCWPSWRPFMPCITGPTACAASPHAFSALPASWPRAWKTPVSKQTTTLFRHPDLHRGRATTGHRRARPGQGHEPAHDRSGPPGYCAG